MNHVMNDINMYEWTCNLELNSRIQGLKSGFLSKLVSVSLGVLGFFGLSLPIPLYYLLFEINLNFYQHWMSVRKGF